MSIDARVVRELVTFVRQALWLVLLLPAVGIAWIALSITWKAVTFDYFYRVRPIVKAMSSAGDGAMDNSPLARDALLRHIPIGTDATTVVADLAGEGFACAKPPTSSDERVVCELQAPAFLGWTNWTVTLQFDESSHLAGARVAIWNVGL